MSTNKGTSINDQNNLLKKKWGGNTAEYDINNAVNNFAKNLEEFNAANTLQQRKDELNALYGGNILNYIFSVKKFFNLNQIFNTT